MRKFVLLALLATIVVTTCATLSAQDSAKYTIENSHGLEVVPADGVRRALLISTGRYINRKIPRLLGVDPDVDLIRERLLDPHCGFQDENVVVLKTADFPTLENINEALDNFLNSCASKDFAFLYLAGHGVRDPKTNVDYYVPQDAKPVVKDGRVVAFDSSTCLSLQTLKEKIERCDAKFKWVIIDACRTNLDARRFEDQWNTIGRLEAAEGSLLFQSCGINQQSYEILVEDDGKNVNHGMFTWYFCQGAKGEASNKDGLISPIGLFKYAREKMKEAREVNRDVPEQAPLYSCQNLSDGEFVFVDLSDDKKIQAQKAYDEALQFFLNGESRQAQIKIDEAITSEPQNEIFLVLKKRIETLLNAEENKETNKQIQEHISLALEYLEGKKYSSALSEVDSVLAFDPDNATAKRLKKQAEDNLTEIPIDYIDSNGTEYRLIKAGAFMMGSPKELDVALSRYWHNVIVMLARLGDRDREGTYKKLKEMYSSPHRIQYVEVDFYLAKYPVTRREFQRFVNETGYHTTAEKKAKQDDDTKTWQSPGFDQTDEHPVVCISYDDARAYIDWLNEKACRDPDLGGFKPLYRLPTDMEWEYACRAGTITEFFWGDDEEGGKDYMNAKGWENVEGEHTSGGLCFPFDDGYPNTSPVGSFKANPWGLYDMLGNVGEWTSGRLRYSFDTETMDSDTQSYAVRGLRSWPMNSRCAFHRPCLQDSYYDDVGFRVAFSLSSENSGLDGKE